MLSGSLCMEDNKGEHGENVQTSSSGNQAQKAQTACTTWGRHATIASWVDRPKPGTFTVPLCLTFSTTISPQQVMVIYLQFNMCISILSVAQHNSSLARKFEFTRSGVQSLSLKLGSIKLHNRVKVSKICVV